MSPRRKIDPDATVAVQVPKRRWRLVPSQGWQLRRLWGLPALASVGAMVIVAAITVSTAMLVSHETDRRAEVKDAEVLGYVRTFMTQFTSKDPFNADAYADRILAQGTGNFLQQFTAQRNEIAILVARGEPVSGSVTEAGIEKWYDDGSASVLVATKSTTSTPDGTTRIESGDRWVTRAIKEGPQWKISELIPVI